MSDVTVRYTEPYPVTRVDRAAPPGRQWYTVWLRDRIETWRVNGQLYGRRTVERA